MIQEFYLNDDGIRLHVKLERPEGAEENDRSPLIIFIHGLTGHMEERHIVALKDTCLQHGFSVLRADLYGHGKSGGDFHEHTMFKWLTNIMTLTDYAKSLAWADGLYLMGHSQGGCAVMLAAGMRPDAYKAVIPLSPATSLEYAAKTGRFLGMDFDPDAVPDKFPNPSENRISGNYIRAMQMLDVRAAMKRYKGPVLIVHGDADQTVPVECAYEAAELYENCRLAIIPKDLHCYDHHLDQAEEAVGDFLEEIKGERF